MALSPVIAAEVSATAAEFRLPAAWLTAQVSVESSGDPWAFRFEPAFYRLANQRGDSGWRRVQRIYGPLAACSYGLMQTLFIVVWELGFRGRPEDLFIPAIGLEWGARKMRLLWDWAGSNPTDYQQALAAYNGGTIGNAKPPYRNQAYVDKVAARVPPEDQVISV